jgi:hypothetical protein
MAKNIKIEAKFKIFLLFNSPQLLNAWEPWRVKGAQSAMVAKPYLTFSSFIV